MRAVRLLKSSGLTLIELLVVIAILAILVGVLFAVIDPIEQKAKANDALTANTAVEYLQGALRFGTDNNGNFPWNIASSCTSIPTSTPVPTATPPPPQSYPCIALDYANCPAGYSCSQYAGNSGNGVGASCGAQGACYSTANSSLCTSISRGPNGGGGCTGGVGSSTYSYFVCKVSGAPNGIPATPTPVPPTPTPVGYSSLPANGIPLDQMTGCNQQIISQGALKQSFTALSDSTLQAVKLYQPNPNLTPADPGSIEVCYQPQANADITKTGNIYSANGVKGACTPTPGVVGCYTCFQ